jgi:hypothetical protein
MTFQKKQKQLRSSVNQFFWQSSSRYDEEVLDLVLEDIANNRVNFDDERFATSDELAYHLMHRQMIKLGHL